MDMVKIDMGRYWIATLILVVGTLGVTSGHAWAGSGDLDTAFGSNGKTAMVPDAGSDDLVVQSDGKIVVLDQWDESVSRWNSDGTRDLSFGQSGIVWGLGYPFGRLAHQDLGAAKHILVGSADYVNRNMEIIWYAKVVRLLPSGAIDTTFQTPGLEGASLDIAVQSDGKVLQLIVQKRPRTCFWNVCEQDTELVRYLARYNQDGSLDASFGTDGTALISFDTSQHPWYETSEIAVQADGKIVTVSPLDGQVIVTRHHPDGTPDASFGSAGIIAVGMPLSVQSAWVETDSSGRLVLAVANCEERCGDATAVVRLNGDGSVDFTFGRYEAATQLVDLMVSGDAVVLAQSEGITRLNADGKPDATFGTGGFVLTNPPYRLRSADLGPDGKILTAGEQDGGTVLARYLSVPAAATGVVAGRVTDASSGAAMQAATVECGSATAISDSDGRYRISDLAPGDYTCSAVAKGYRKASRSVTVKAGTIAVLDFALRRGK